MNQTLKQKLLALTLVTTLVFGQVAPVIAQEAPSTPTAPTISVATTSTQTAPSAPTAPTAPSSTPEEEAQQQETSTEADEVNATSDDEVVSNTDPNAGHFDPTLTPEEVAVKNAEREARKAAAIAAMNSTNGQTGDVEIDTGDATNGASVVTGANNNLAGTATCCGSSAGLINSGNGTGSTNTGSASINNTNNTNQNNSAVVNSDLTQGSSTGYNSASKNVGSSSITTGDANTTGTVVTAVNTNVAGVMVSEFNIADDHVGDILLDFNSACVTGCAIGDYLVKNTGNGSDSTNTGNLDVTNTNNTTQTNIAGIGNDLVLTADSGHNLTNQNTGGDSDITTGDANVAANVLTFANNNIAGNVVFGVVNVFGDLIGDILFPEDQVQSAGNIAAVNSGNGADSTNTTDLTLNNTNNTFQSNDADIANNLVFDAQTGDNSSSKNTGGDSSISTGDTNIDANVLNIVNSNINGGTWWLVLVNEAGNWLGKIVGAPDGAHMAGSAGTDFQVDENGYITAVNNGNGAGSTNDASVTQTNTTNITQTNDATVANNLYLTANTGANEASQNTGGNSKITTGDANIVANLVNFVNNNIVGNGKLVVTMVNVFGSWAGDFVLPGQQKQAKAEQRTENVSDNRGGTSNSQSQNTQTAHANPTPTKVSTLRARMTASDDAQQGTVSLTTNGNSTMTEQVAGVSIERAPLVKSIKSLVNSSAADKEKITVNLAWMLLVLPFAGIALIGKKLSRRILLPKV